MHGLSNIVVASKRERKIAHSATDMSAGKVVAYPCNRTNKFLGIVVVFLNACSDGQDVRVENDVKGIHAHLLRKDVVSTFGNFNSSFKGSGLSFFVKTHHNACSAKTFQSPCMFYKLLFTLFQRDRVNDTFALHTFKSCHDYLPFRRVDHDGHACYFGFGCNHVEKGCHFLFCIKQPIVHIDV